MITAELPAALAAVSGVSSAHISQALRRLRESAMLPTGRSPPPFTGQQVARVVFALCVDHLPTLAAEVARLETAPSRTVPTYGLPTASDALAELIEHLQSGQIRTIGAIDVNRSLNSIAIHTFNDDGLPVVKNYGSGDAERHGIISTTVVVPLTVVLSVARLLNGR